MTQQVIERSTGRADPAYGRVVAGFDGSAGSTAAVEWAAREADRRGCTLKVVRGRTIPEPIDYYGIGARQSADLYALSARLETLYPELDLDVEATVLDPRDALLAEARQADLLVVGSTEVGAARRLLYGSVSRTAARRGPCPVVVIKGTPALTPIRHITVGVDGSTPADTALLWAANEANLHGAEIVVTHGWDHSEPRGAAVALVEAAVGRCRAHTSAKVRGLLFDGDGQTALTAASLEADLIVIGSRGRSGFKTMLFGSVALSVTDQAACPVVVTHPVPRPA